MAWLGAAALSAGEALLSVYIASFYPTTAWLRWAPSAILAGMYPRKGGESLAVTAAVRKSSAALGGAMAYERDPLRRAGALLAVLGALSARHNPLFADASGRNLRVESVLGFRCVVWRASLAHANRNFDCRLGI